MEEEHKWMQDHKLQYLQDTVVNRKTKLRDFVYSTMNSQFSNLTIKLFRNTIQRKYGEFITVHKPSNLFGANVQYIARDFLGGSGYIVTCNETSGMAILLNDFVEQMCSKWVVVCKQKKVSLLEMHNMIDDIYNDEPDKSLDNIETPNGKTIDKCDTYTRCITPIESVRKQPRMNNILRFDSIDDDGECKYICNLSIAYL